MSCYFVQRLRTVFLDPHCIFVRLGHVFVSGRRFVAQDEIFDIAMSKQRQKDIEETFSERASQFCCWTWKVQSPMSQIFWSNLRNKDV